MTKQMKAFVTLGTLLLAPLAAQAEGMLTPEEMQRSMARVEQQEASIERLKDHQEARRANSYRPLSELEPIDDSILSEATPRSSELPNLDPNAATGSVALLMIGGAMVALGHRQRHISE